MPQGFFRKFRSRVVRPSVTALAGPLIALAVAPPAIAQGQTGTVSGTVINEGGQPVPGAQVALVGTGLGTLTNNAGKYTMVNVPAAQYRIRAQMIGHRPVEDAV